MIVYTLKKRKGTGEYHLFEAKHNATKDACTPNVQSVCKKMNNSDSIETAFACQSEEYARSSAATYGRSACGTCISHLYADF